MLLFQMLWPTKYDPLGYIPQFLSADDSRLAKEQFNQNYWPGWHKMEGFTLNRKTMALRYPGDPPLLPLAMAVLRNETIYVYPHAWVLILSANGDFEVARLD